MSLAKLTILSFNKYFKDRDSDLFEKLALPEGIDKETLVNNILLEGADFEILYSNPYFMQDAIGLWSDKYYRTFDKWITALNIDYNPLENYDRIEDFKEHSVDSRTDTTNENITGSSNGTLEASKSAFDSNTYSPNEKNITSDTNSSTSKATNTSNDTFDNSRSGRTHGNIGVTTSQQMLESELEISKWNIYKHITDLFIDEFMLQIYI